MDHERHENSGADISHKRAADAGEHAGRQHRAGARQFDVDPGGNQRPAHLVVAVARCKHEWREADMGCQVGIGLVGQQKSNNFWVWCR